MLQANAGDIQTDHDARPGELEEGGWVLQPWVLSDEQQYSGRRGWHGGPGSRVMLESGHAWW